MTDRQRRIQSGVEMLQWVEQQGVVLYGGQQERETAKEYLRAAAAIFPDLVSKLSAVYLFRQSEQMGDYISCDGICWWKGTPGGMKYALGLSTEALDEGKAYFVGLFCTSWPT